MSWDVVVTSLRNGLASVKTSLLTISTLVPSEVKCSPDVLPEVLETAKVALSIYHECTRQRVVPVLRQMLHELRKCESIECVRALLDEYEETLLREPWICH